MDNKEKKLTGMEGKSYHGSMTENGDKLPERKPEIPEDKPVEKKGVKQEGKRIDEGAQGRKTDEYPIDLNNTTRKQREEFAKARKALEGEPGGEKQKGIFDILLDLLKALFGVDDEKAEKMIEDSEAMRGVQAYWRIKPQNKWDPKDYARVLFMLAADTSDASMRLRTKFESDAKEKGIKDKDFKLGDISEELGKIRKDHPESYLKRDDERSEQERRVEMVHRAVVMNGKLWMETKGSSVFDKLSGERLAAFGNDIRLLGQRNYRLLGQENDASSEDDYSINYLLSDIDKGMVIKEEITRGSGSKDKFKKDDGKKVEGDKAKEAIKKFSPKNKEAIEKALESGDPDYIRHVFDVFRKNGLDQKVIKRAIDGFLRDYEVDIKRGSVPQENTKRVADLLRGMLVGLDVSGGGGRSNAGYKVEKEDRQDDGQDKLSDQGGNAGKEEDEEFMNSSLGGGDKGEGGGDGKGEKPVNLMTPEEKNEYYLKRIEKHTGKISETTLAMLGELREINKNLTKFTETYIDTIIKNPNEIYEHPEDFRKMQRIYIAQRSRELEIQSALDEMAGEEKSILGGERDKWLYAGNVDQAVGERMNRIDYFIKKKKDPAYLDPNGGDLEKIPSSLNDPRVSLDEPGLSDDEKKRRKETREKVREKIFRMRMQKTYNEIKDEDIVSKQEGLYFQEIQRWVGSILKNTDIGYKGQSGELRMSEEIHEEFKKIKEMPSNIYDYGNANDPKAIKDFEDKILGAVEKLKKLKFLEYYKGVSYLNFEGKGIDPVKKEVTGSYGYPASLEATMMLIANDKGAEWRTGGVHELIDASGKFHRENFLLWMRGEIWRQADWDPTVPIDSQRGITFKAGFSQITLWDILYLPQYTQHQEIEMKGDTSSLYKEGGTRSFKSGWEESAKEHPDMPYAIRVDDILLEAWYAGLIHNDWVALYDIKARGGKIEDWVATQQKIANFNNYSRSGLPFRHFTLAGHKEKEDKNYYDKKEQGSLGQMIQAGILFYRHQAEFTEKYMRKDGVANLDDNMAYKALDHDGSSVFVMSIAESALGMADQGAQKEIKKAYGAFLLTRLKEIEEKYSGKAQDEGGKKKMDTMINNCRKEIEKLKSEKQGNLKISFDNFDKLVNLQLKIENVIMGKRIVSEDDRKHFAMGDKAVSREEVKNEIDKGMRENIGSFLEDVMKIEIPEVEEKDNGEKKKIERDANGNPIKKAIGKIEVYTDDRGRIVTRGEWKKMGEKEGNIKTIQQIKDEFVGKDVAGEDRNKLFQKNWEKLERYEVSYKQAHDDYESAKKNNSADLSIKEQKYLKIKGDYDDILSRHEGLGLAMLTKVANMSRSELNIFRTTLPSRPAKEMMKEALKKSLGKIYGLEDMEARYGYDRVWYLLNHMEIADFNNTGLMPGAVQQGTYYSNTIGARNAAFRTGKGGGSEETMEEVLALRLPTMLERMRVMLPGEGDYEHMFIDILQKGKGRDMKPRWERKLENDTNTNYRVPDNWEHTDFIDQLDHSENLRKLIVEEDIELGSFHEIVTIDAWGVMKVDHAKARKLIDAYYNQARLNYGSQKIEYNDKIAVMGREVSIREHMMGEKTRKTQDVISKYYGELVEKLKKEGNMKDAKAYELMAQEIYDKPGLAVTMNMITAGIHEHMKFGSNYKMWSTQLVGEVAWILDKYLGREGAIEMVGKDGNTQKIEKMPSVMPYELFVKLLGVHEDSMDKFMFWDLFKCLVDGFIAGFGEVQKEMEDELTGQPKKQWIG